MFFGPQSVRAQAWAAALWLFAATAGAQGAPPPPPQPQIVIRPHEASPAAGAQPSRPSAPAKVAVQKRIRPPGLEPDPAESTPEGKHPIRIGLSSGYGFDLDPSVTGVNPFGVSFGVRGGYALGPVYLGTRFLFFVGQSRVLSDGTELSADEWLLGFEGGYGWRAGPLVLRPELGFGLAISSSEAAREGTDPSMPVPVDTSSEDPYLELGVVLELDLTKRFLIGVEGRSTAVFGKATASADAELFALQVVGTLGFRF